MKGILVGTYGGPEVLEYGDVPEPVAGAGEILIDVRGASVNFADLKSRSGSYHLGKQPPFVPGIDCAGTVIQIGPGVTRFKPGERVVAFSSSGAYAEKAVADERLSFHLPRSIDFDTAAAFPLVAGAAMHMLVSVAGMKRGQRVLIHGASGGVGSAAIQIARALGASIVAATTGSPWKREYLTGIGADTVLALDAYIGGEDPALSAGGEGFDIILNPIGGELVVRDIRALNDFGKLVLFGSMSGPVPAISADSLYSRNKQLVGFSFGHCRKFRPETIAATMEQVIEFVAAGQVAIPVHGHHTLQDAASAHQEMEARRVTGKIVLAMNRRADT